MSDTKEQIKDEEKKKNEENEKNNKNIGESSKINPRYSQTEP